MYRIQYAAIDEDAPCKAKMHERDLLQRSIDLFQKAMQPNAPHTSSVEAIFFTSRVWTTLLQDLANPENQLPAETRASLISIGIWILKQLDAIRAGESERCADVIEITEIIRDGLYTA